MFMVAIINTLLIVLMILSSLVVSFALYYLSSKILTKILEKLDLAL